MDEALGSGSYDDYRSRSRSPSRRGFNANYNNNRRGDVDPYFDNGNDYRESRRGRGRGGFRRGGFRGGRGRGSFRGGFRGSRGGFRREHRGSYGSGRRGGFEYEPTPIDRNYENSIFVGNLSFDCTPEDLREHFSGIGEIVSADIIYSHGRHKGMGTVEFVDHQMVEDAINQLDGTMFMDRDIFVKQDRAPPGSERRNERRLEFSGRDQESTFTAPPGAKLDGYEVFIVNLPYATTWQDLKDLFRQAGDVIRADVELDFRGFSRGFGNVFFPTKEEMYKAIDMFNGYDLDGRVLEVREGRYNHLVDEERRGREGFLMEEERQPRTESRFDNGDKFDSSDKMDEEPIEDVAEEPIPVAPVSTFTEGIVGGGDKNNIVYCANLPLATSSTDLYELFESFGKVEKAELKFDQTGAPTGIAVVEYIDADTAELCISKLNNYNYGGNDLAVSYAQHSTEL